MFVCVCECVRCYVIVIKQYINQEYRSGFSVCCVMKRHSNSKRRSWLRKLLFDARLVLLSKWIILILSHFLFMGAAAWLNSMLDHVAYVVECGIWRDDMICYLLLLLVHNCRSLERFFCVWYMFDIWWWNAFSFFGCSAYPILELVGVVIVGVFFVVVVVVVV